jgi:hypothetical protein
VGGYEKPQKPPPGTMAVYTTGVFPQFPAHQIPGSSVYNHGYYILKPAQEPELLSRDPVVL